MLSTPYPEMRKWLLESWLHPLVTGICDSKAVSLELEYPCTSVTPCSGLHLKPSHIDAWYRLYKMRGCHGEGCCKAAKKIKNQKHFSILTCLCVS